MRVQEAAAWTERCAICKTIIMSLPSFEGRSGAEALEMLARAVERAIEALGLEYGGAG